MAKNPTMIVDQMRHVAAEFARDVERLIPDTSARFIVGDPSGFNVILERARDGRGAVVFVEYRRVAHHRDTALVVAREQLAELLDPRRVSRSAPPMEIVYRNWEGKTERRRLADMKAPYWGANQWHRRPQWLMDAIDADTGQERTFAMENILAIGSTPNPYDLLRRPDSTGHVRGG